jgi:hypothetical protein
MSNVFGAFVNVPTTCRMTSENSTPADLNASCAVGRRWEKKAKLGQRRSLPVFHVCSEGACSVGALLVSVHPSRQWMAGEPLAPT